MNGDSAWRRLAEQSARARSRKILATIERVVAEHAPDAAIVGDDQVLRVRAKNIVRRWIGESSFRFARRFGR